jgi:hypothetical protein
VNEIPRYERRRGIREEGRWSGVSRRRPRIEVWIAHKSRGGEERKT